MTAARFPFVHGQPVGGLTTATAIIPLTLEHGPVRVAVGGVLEPSATANVLPHALGLRLGAVWSRHTSAVAVPGEQTPIQAIPLTIRGSVAPFGSVILVFAWAATDAVPVILGQMNFLQAFDVCFHHARSHVEVRPGVRPGP